MTPAVLQVLAWLVAQTDDPLATSYVLARRSTLRNFVGGGGDPAVTAALRRLHEDRFIELLLADNLNDQDEPSLEVLAKGRSLIEQLQVGMQVHAVVGDYPHTIHDYRVSVTRALGKFQAQIQGGSDAPAVHLLSPTAGSLADLVGNVMDQVCHANQGCPRFEVYPLRT